MSEADAEHRDVALQHHLTQQAGVTIMSGVAGTRRDHDRVDRVVI